MLSVIFAVAAMSVGATAQELSTAPTVFRGLKMGGLFPDLEVADQIGSKQILSVKGAQPSLVAFLRPDQDDSKRVLEVLGRLALDPEEAPVRLFVVGLPGREHASWAPLSKGLPRRITLFLDKYGAAKAIGVIVVPSVALMDAAGRLRSSFVLFDEGLEASLRKRLVALSQGTNLVVDEGEREQMHYERIAANAVALEAAGMLKEALELCQQNLKSGLHQAEAHAQIGRLYLGLNDADLATVHLRRSFQLESNVRVRVWLGRALAQSGDLAGAKRELSAALELSPDKAVIHRTLARIAKEQGDIDEALRHMRAAIAALQKTINGGRDAPR